MRKIVVVLAGCFVLSGCGAADWKHEVRFIDPRCCVGW